MRKIILLLGAAIAGLVTMRWLTRPRESIDWKAAPYPGRIIDVDGVGVHYVEQGSGPAVVLVHGFGGLTFSFRYTMPALAADHRVVALDLKGFGYSERPARSNYSVTAQARLVIRFMDILKIKKAALVGHSMGGEVVMRVAAMAPERVEKLVLAASVSGDRIPTLPVTPLIKPWLTIFARLFGRRFFLRCFFDRSKATDAVFEAYRAPALIKGSRDAIYQLARDSRKDKRIEYSRITQPVLILWAAAERIVPNWALGRLRSKLPQARVDTIERAGHLLLEEQPEACNEAIGGFLAGERKAKAPAETTLERADSPAPAS